MNPPPRLIEPVSDDTLRAIARGAFGAGVRLREARLLPGGQFNTTYYLETLEPAHRVVVRIAPPDDRWLFRYERGMMAAEPWIYARMAEAGVPVASVVALDASRTVLDRVYIIQEFVDALPLSDARVPETARPGLWREAGRWVARMHAVEADAFGWPARADGPPGGSWGNVFGDLLDETLEAALTAEIIPPDEALAARRWYAGRRASFDAVRVPALVHNDVWAPNILVGPAGDGWTVRAVIDADRAVFADREFEYVLWDDDAHRADFMAGYGRPLEASPEAAARRACYRFYWYLFAAWCYRCQIVRPEAQEPNRRVAMGALAEMLGA